MLSHAQRLMDFCCQDGNDVFHRVLFFSHEFRCLLTKQSLMLPEQKPALSALCAWLSKKKQINKKIEDRCTCCLPKLCLPHSYLQVGLEFGGRGGEGGQRKGGRQPDYSSDSKVAKEKHTFSKQQVDLSHAGRTSLGPESSDER